MPQLTLSPHSLLTTDEAMALTGLTPHQLSEMLTIYLIDGAARYRSVDVQPYLLSLDES